MKIILTVLCVVALATLANTNSATWGRTNNTDTMIVNETVLRFPSRNYWDVNVVFPRSGSTNNRLITAVIANDNFRNNTGATPTIISGGPGFRFATIKLRSQYDRGINTTVKIYVK